MATEKALKGRRLGAVRTINRRVVNQPIPLGVTMVTVRELAHRWGITERTIINLEEAGVVPARTEGHRRIWSVDAIRKFENVTVPDLLLSLYKKGEMNERG